MTTLTCPKCSHPLLAVENLENLVTQSAEPAAAPAPSSPPHSQPGAVDPKSTNRRHFPELMALLETWCSSEPWAGWEEPVDLFAGFEGWLRRERGYQELKISQNRFSRMLGELGAEWRRVNKGRVYCMPPALRPDSMGTLVEAVGGADIPTDTPPGNKPLLRPVLGFSPERTLKESAGPDDEPATGAPPAGEEPATGDNDHAGAGAREDADEPTPPPPPAAAPKRSVTFPAHTEDCALASTSGAAPCDCGATPPHPVVGDEPVETVGDEAGNEEPSGPPALPTPDAGFVVPRSDAAADALERRQAAADPLAAPLVPVDRIPAVVAEGAAAEDARVEAAAAVSRQEFLRGVPAPQGPSSPFAVGTRGEEGE